MTRLAATLVLSALFVPVGEGIRPATDYSAGRRLRIESSLELEMETTLFEISRNGEPLQGQDELGPGGSVEERKAVVVDEVLESRDGAPARLRRNFVTVGGSRSSERGGERELECPLDGVTLELAVDEAGGVEVEVVEGEVPDDEEVLEGHLPRLAADALLPDREVEVGDSWELGDEAVRRLLGLDVDRALFRRPERPEGRFGRGGGDGRRGPGRGGLLEVLRDAEWSATAELTDDAEDRDGEPCARIELVLTAEGELPEREFRVGGRRMPVGAPSGPLESGYSVELRGTMLFSLAERHPISLEVEGDVSTRRHVSHESDHGTFEMRREEAGTLALSVEVSLDEGD